MIAEATRALGSTQPPVNKVVARALFVRIASLSSFLLAFASLSNQEHLARYALLTLAFVFSVPYALWFRGLGLSPRATMWHLAMDMGIITVFAVLDGGGHSDIFLLYPLVVFSAAVVVPFVHASRIALVCALLWLVVAAATNWGWSWYVAAPAVPLTAVLSMPVALLLFLGLGVFVARRCGYTDARTAQLRRLAEVLFKNLPAGLMLLDSDDRIVLANDRASNLFGLHERVLKHHRLVDLLAPETTGERPWGGADQSSTALRFRRLDGSLFPAFVETGRVSLGGDQFGGEGDADFTVVTLTDISRLLEMQRRIQEKERLRTVASMATHIAHEVRNPVAAISGSAQVLDKLEKGSKAGDTVSDALLGTEREKLYDCIVSESSRLDEIIAKFISCTEFSEEKLQMLLRMTEETQPPASRPSAAAKVDAPASTAA